MRRKPGVLLPIELAICRVAERLRRRGTHEFHGYELAKAIRAEGPGSPGKMNDARLLTAYGTLYRALGRLESMGLLRSRWEDPSIPARENRPGRRLYTLTALADTALETARTAAPAKTPKRARPRFAPA